MKHPDFVAFEKWEETDEAKKCNEGAAVGEYLKNRLWHAFMAGRRSFEKEINVDRDKIV